jgi:beta-galactosidase
MIEASGKPCFAHRHMVCWEHPEARAEAFRTIETLATRYGNHPAVWGWQIDNEPNFAEDPSACYDFNPHAIRRGQEWLRERHGSLEALNKAWFNAFWSQSCNEWEQVWVTHRPQVNPGSMLDFLRCREASVARFVQDQAALLRRCTTGQKIGVNIPEVGIPFSTVIAQD